MEANRKPFTFLFWEVAREYQLQGLRISLLESLTPAELMRKAGCNPLVPPTGPSLMLSLGNSFCIEREACYCKMSYPAVPNRFGTRDRFHGRQFSHGSWGDGLGMVQVHYVYCALYFYYYYISCTSDHRALDPGGWRPWPTTQGATEPHPTQVWVLIIAFPKSTHSWCWSVKVPSRSGHISADQWMLIF